MIESVQFKNFKVLRDTTLPLQRFTLIVGPNGSGKSTALQAMKALAQPPGTNGFDLFATAGLDGPTVQVQTVVAWDEPYEGIRTTHTWPPQSFNRETTYPTSYPNSIIVRRETEEELGRRMSRIRVYSLDAHAIAKPVQVAPMLELAENGANLPGVLDSIKSEDDDRWKDLQDEFTRWLPEFDRIVLPSPTQNFKAIQLRTREGGYRLPACDLSQGTLIALALLTLAYLPDPPSLVCLKEPDRGMHPRLLRDVRDALYRLAYPQDFGATRAPVQVIATTHSPYMLDLFQDHPEEIVIAEKTGLEAKFKSLSDYPHLSEILEDAHLSDVWYTGILGGVPAGT